MYFTPFCLLTVGETLPLLNVFTISPSLAELRYCALSAQARWCPLRPSRGDCPFVALRSTNIRCFMQHNFLFPKVASPSQCASLRHDVGHCTCSLALLPFFFRTFQACNTLWLPVSQAAKFIQNVANIFIFHLTQNFRPATQGASYNLTKSPTAKSLTSNAGPRPRHSSPKCGWRH